MKILVILALILVLLAFIRFVFIGQNASVFDLQSFFRTLNEEGEHFSYNRVYIDIQRLKFTVDSIKTIFNPYDIYGDGTRMIAYEYKLYSYADYIRLGGTERDWQTHLDIRPEAFIYDTSGNAVYISFPDIIDLPVWDSVSSWITEIPKVLGLIGQLIATIYKVCFLFGMFAFHLVIDSAEFLVFGVSLFCRFFFGSPA